MSDLIIKKDKNSAWITLNRPKFKNAFSEEMISELCEVLFELDLDPETKVIVITGAGDCFCAGGDLKAMDSQSGMFAGDSFELKNRYEKGIQQIPRVMEQINTPMIAMVNGPAIGAGCDFTAMCDFRISSTKSKFGVTFAKIGLVPGDGGPYFISRIIGHSKAMEMYLTGKVYQANEALELGLINQVVAPEELEEEVTKFVHRLSLIPKTSLTMTKNAVKVGAKQNLDQMLNLVAAYQGIAQRTSEHKVAVEKLLKKS